MIRLALAALVVAAALAGCGGQQQAPQVTFTAGGTSVTARPTQHCDVQVQNCTADPAAAVALRVPPGQAVQISVPQAVSQTPWLVVFGYRTAAGERVNARSDLFASNDRPAYTLVLPATDDQLETVEVQQISGTFIPGPQGMDFPTRATWVLSVDDRTTS